MKPVRVELAYRANYGVRRGKIEWIVMHYTANDGDSGMSNARYFQKALNPVASAHYFVDDREIVQSVPDEYVAYHCGAYKYRHPFCRNYNSIGIEMCDSKRDGTVKATEQTIRNAAELAAALDVSEEKVMEIMQIAREPASLETPIGEEDDSNLGDFVADGNVVTPEGNVESVMLREHIDALLGDLKERERQVIILRFGLEDGHPRTLEEVGKAFNVTRERIRQIEAKALRKLRNPVRSKRIRDFL